MIKKYLVSPIWFWLFLGGLTVAIICVSFLLQQPSIQKVLKHYYMQEKKELTQNSDQKPTEVTAQAEPETSTSKDLPREKTQDQVATQSEALVKQNIWDIKPFKSIQGELKRLNNGVTWDSKLEPQVSTKYAGELVVYPQSFHAQYNLKLLTPKPHAHAERLEQLNPYLSSLLVDWNLLLSQAEPSPLYRKLYAEKILRVRKEAESLNEIMHQRNFYDCETALKIKHPTTGRSMLWVQSDMDVVSDGSDGDRMPVMSSQIMNSDNYQPFTSYGWKKTGSKPNPLLKVWEARLRKEKQENGASTSKAKYLSRAVKDLKSRSFLIAEIDPFIVLPTNWLNDKSGQAPRVGDYAIVIYKNQLYPAIVGDAGPYHKIGEASLKLATTIDPNSNPYRRACEGLEVSYLVFPGTAESPKKAPNYEHWKQRCFELLQEMGGLHEGVELHTW